MDTIFAEATAAGKAGVSVVRLSGPAAFEMSSALVRTLPQPRVLAFRHLRDAAGELLDDALVVCFPAPHSFTGEDVVELHLHGSRAVVQAVLRALAGMPSARMAEPGEFTRRALLNGKLDLTQVEGLADLIEAETEAQRRQAQRSLAGAFREFIESLRSDLVRAAALLEATIDFADEDIPEDVSDEVLGLISQVLSRIQEQIESSRFSERVRHGFEVAIVGRPNVGKSTLLNALAGREAAITSEYAGTTRDVIEVRMDLGGIPVTLLDTAGIRDAADPVERIGVDLARKRARDADLRVFLVEEGDVPEFTVQKDDLVVSAKADLSDAVGLAVSGVTGYGLDRLVQEITARLQDRVARAGLATHERHRLALEQSVGHLVAAHRCVVAGPEEFDIASEELRTALRRLDILVGRVGVEDLLDVIFSSFCLGK